MSAHTPGPWNCRFSAGAYYFGGSYITIGQVYSNDPNKEANVRLIVAAPDMLAVLKEIREDRPAWETLEDDTRARGRAAIAKAEGRES